MNLFSLHCRGVNSINDEVKYTQKPRAMQMFAEVPKCRGREYTLHRSYNQALTLTQRCHITVSEANAAPFKSIIT